MARKKEAHIFLEIHHFLIETTAQILLSVSLFKLVWSEVEALLHIFGIFP